MRRNNKAGIYSNNSIRYNKFTNTKTVYMSKFIINDRIIQISKNSYVDYEK
jgi:hypothetical protein